jgi:iron complex outermembrane recepter protein
MDDTLIDSRTVLDAALTCALDEAWRIEGFGTNLTNRTYVASINQGGTNSLGGRLYDAPRQYGIRLKWK